MVDNDRKRKILAHLSQSTEEATFLTPKTQTPKRASRSIIPESQAEVSDTVDVPVVPIASEQTVDSVDEDSPEVPEPPAPKLSEKELKKQQILAHLNQSSLQFGDLKLQESSTSDSSKIRDHVKKSLA